jgi:hypothetical protein
MNFLCSHLAFALLSLAVAWLVVWFVPAEGG